MGVSDPIADFLTRLRNATNARHRYVDVNWSKMKQSIAETLKEQGFIEGLLVRLDAPTRGVMRVFLRYTDTRLPVIQGIKRVSKPGLRRYVGSQEIPYFYGGMGISILSTSQGIISGKEASKRNIGGELLCIVW